MLPRFKGLVLLTCTVLGLYFVLWQDTALNSGQHAVDVLKGSFGSFGDVELSSSAAPEQTKIPDSENRTLEDTEDVDPKPSPTNHAHIPSPVYSTVPPEITGSPELEHAAQDTTFANESAKGAPAEPVKPSGEARPEINYSNVSLQVQFDKEYKNLGLNETAGAIYGSTLNALFDSGAHEGFAAAALEPAKFWPLSSDIPPYTYNPYPDYNSKTWQAGNQGEYVSCEGPQGPIADLMVFSGHPKAFENPQMGSYIPLNIDSNMCFERSTRLGAYDLGELTVDWGMLQQKCLKKNTNRYYGPPSSLSHYSFIPAAGRLNSTSRSNSIRNAKISSMARRLEHITKRYFPTRQEVGGDVGDRQREENGPLGHNTEDNFEFSPAQFDEKGSLFSASGDHNAANQDSEQDVTQFSAVGGHKFANDDSENDTSQFSDLGEDKSFKEDAQYDISQSSGLGDGESIKDSQHDVSQFSAAGDDTSVKEDSQLDFPKLPGLGEDKSVKEEPEHDVSQFSGLNEDESFQGPGKDVPEFPDIAEGTLLDQGLSEDEAKGQGLHGMPLKVKIMPTARTAVLIRAHSHLNFTENDKQNIRAMVTELCLRSGGEYQIFLLIEWKDETPIFSDKVLYSKALGKSVPKEFASMTVLWSNAKMAEAYPLISREDNNEHQSQWLSVQWFAQQHREFDFYWNWEFDTRYTGHYYNLLENLASFAKAQPRKGLWERNERYYIPSYHGRYSKFIKDVEKISSANSVWGAPNNVHVTPIGPVRPVGEPKYDNYEWGVGENADYISLSPIFDPVKTSWPGRDDISGFDKSTPRRASIGTQSRCSKRLLDLMHVENKKGTHISSEMAPQTISLLHGLKAVFAPIPIFFDRPWAGSSLQRYFNPGPKGESGSSEESPYSLGRETRFQGSSWSYRATPPQRLYNNFLGWEDAGIGGPEWEKSRGRTCLPPMLLHPIRSVIEPRSGSSK